MVFLAHEITVYKIEKYDILLINKNKTAYFPSRVTSLTKVKVDIIDNYE